MGRKRTSAAEDFVDLVAMLPWWGGVAAAVGFYLVLHRYAAPPDLSAVAPGQAAAVLLQGGIISAFARIGQYLLPFLCLLAALISFLRRRKRQGLLRDAAHSSDAKPLDGISWRDFEMLVGEAYRTQGYAVTETGGGGADGGVDLLLRKEGKTYLVQCKQWKAFTVPVNIVRELYGVMVHRKADGGFVITSGRFTADAAAFAKGKNIQLVDGAKLIAQIRSAGAVPAAAPATAPVESEQPSCPQCGSGMVRRTAKKGTNAGNQFWGCSRYPQCRGVR
jgi:restriction system protein